MLDRKPFGIVGVFAASCFLSGCPYESRVPLTPSAEGALDPVLVGDWRCVSSDSEKVALLTVTPFDERQYYVGAAYEGSPPVPFRAYVSSVKGHRILNVRALAPAGPVWTERWFFVRYSSPSKNALEIECVRKEALQGDPQTEADLRSALSAHIDDASAYEQYAVCARVLSK